MTVRVRREGKRWIVTGGGRTLEFDSNQAATFEFNRRARRTRQSSSPEEAALKRQWGIDGIEFGTPVPFGRGKS